MGKVEVLERVLEVVIIVLGVVIIIQVVVGNKTNHRIRIITNRAIKIKPVTRLMLLILINKIKRTKLTLQKIIHINNLFSKLLEIVTVTVKTMINIKLILKRWKVF